MIRKAGSGGRVKRVTAGGGNVFRRGGGRSSGRRGGRVRRTGGGAGCGGCLGEVVIAVIVMVVAVFASRLGLMDEPGEEDYGSAGTYGDSVQQIALAQTEAVPANHTVAQEAREKYTRLLGDGEDTVTIMVYMCGTDLESRYGMATSDINEMLHAEISDSVNMIVQTGGTKKWQNSVISGKTNQIYQIKNDGIVRLKSDLGKKSMTDPGTLTDFIDFCEENFPASRNMLIMWDHGGGSNTGYGYDEHFRGSMTLDLFNRALRDAGCRFDIIGFDACLMATLETALVAEQYGDYLLASEETEPGGGWYYTDWLTALSRDPSMDTVTLGKHIIDDYTDASKKQAPHAQTTLSLVDLGELKGTVPRALSEFSSSTAAMIDSGEYKAVSDARSGAREFASGINQIDLVNFAENLGTPQGGTLAEALRGCVKYNRVSRSLRNANGISAYFPCRSLSSMGSMMDIYEEIGMDEAYTDCIRSFASMSSGGQLVSSSTGWPLSSLFGDMSGSGSTPDMLEELLSSALGGSYGGSGDYDTQGNSYFDLVQALTGSDWMDEERAMAAREYYKKNSLDASRLTITRKDGRDVLELTDEEWDLVQEVELNVFADDGEGFINLGLDNTYTFTDDLDLLMEYDNTWLAINGQVVCYKMLSNDVDGDTYAITGSVPALLNGEEVELILIFTDEDPYGTVAGARKIYGEDEADTVMKGLIPINKGDVLDFLCDYYTYDGEYVNTFMMGNRMRVNGPLEISNVDIGDMNALATYRLTDIYGSPFWTQSMR